MVRMYLPLCRCYSVPRLMIRWNRAILDDPVVYPDPSVFNPERFLKDGKINPEVQDPEVAAFGYGHRIWFVLLSALCANWWFPLVLMYSWQSWKADC